jgi:alkylation response protein AidB-like acyl-CoA dehydrogenase
MTDLRRELSFLLYEWLDAPTLTARDRHAEHDREGWDAVLDTCARIARTHFEPFNRKIDAEEPRWDGARVVLPRETREAIAAFADAGLLAGAHDAELGGMQLPYVIETAGMAFFHKASVGLSGYALLTMGNANLLRAHGTPAQIDAFVRPALAGRAFGTMCLSEPDAGSSLSDITTRAVADGDDHAQDPLGPRHRLTGTKMWISGGEHEMGENIHHLVLAKVPDAQGRLTPGVRGISLFVVPRRLVAADGTVTDVRNDVTLAGLNHKCGYRGTVNTLLSFGEGRHTPRGAAGAIGYLVGPLGRGLACMFHMMNEARIGVGLGAAMLGRAGYELSVGYARDRRQGRPLGPNGKDPSRPPVAIIEHADVRRMLLAQKAYCEGALALGLYCARLVDEQRTGTADAARDAGVLLELLTPIAKSWPSEWCLEGNSLAIQVLGGYGYARDFAAEQLWRDNRLNMIHEGAHGIHGLDLLGRKVVMDGGRAVSLLAERVRATIAAARRHPELTAFAAALEGALENVGASTAQAWAAGDPEATLANATPYLQAFGHTVLAWLWLDLACSAREGLAADGPSGEDFYRGKLAAARYFFRYELGRVEPWLAVVRAREDVCRTMQDRWF